MNSIIKLIPIPNWTILLASLLPILGSFAWAMPMVTPPDLESASRTLLDSRQFSLAPNLSQIIQSMRLEKSEMKRPILSGQVGGIYREWEAYEAQLVFSLDSFSGQMIEHNEKRVLYQLQNQCYATLVRHYLADLVRKGQASPQLELVSFLRRGNTLAHSNQNVFSQVASWLVGKQKPVILKAYARLNNQQVLDLTVGITDPQGTYFTVGSHQGINVRFHHAPNENRSYLYLICRAYEIGMKKPTTSSEKNR